MTIKMPSHINLPFSTPGETAWHRSDKISWLRDWVIQGRMDILFYSLEIVGKDITKGLRGVETLIYQGKTGFVYYAFSTEELTSGFFEEGDLQGAFYYSEDIPVSFKLEYKGRMFKIKEKRFHPDSFRTDIILSPVVEN